jgi:carboxypeptidase Q
MLKIQPRRTIRLVLWTNEENGVRGALAYRDAFRDEATRHVLALESDTGVFSPIGLGFSGSEAARKQMDQIAALLAPLGITSVTPGGGGADIGPIAEIGGIPTMSLNGDPSKYFTIHHTPADTIDRITPQEVSHAAAAVAAVVYVVAEMPERLSR